MENDYRFRATGRRVGPPDECDVAVALELPECAISSSVGLPRLVQYPAHALAGDGVEHLQRDPADGRSIGLGDRPPQLPREQLGGRTEA